MLLVIYSFLFSISSLLRFLFISGSVDALSSCSSFSFSSFLVHQKLFHLSSQTNALIPKKAQTEAAQIPSHFQTF